MEKELRELFCVKIGLENALFKKRMLKQSTEVLLNGHIRLTRCLIYMNY